jgi:vacuolar-type H+-ATPase subunit H
MRPSPTSILISAFFAGFLLVAGFPSPTPTYAAKTTCVAKVNADYDKKIASIKSAFLSTKAKALTTMNTAIERAKKDSRKLPYLGETKARESVAVHRKEMQDKAKAEYEKAFKTATDKRDLLLSRAEQMLKKASARCIATK